MRIGVVGINAKSSELSLREHLAKAAAKLFGCDALEQMHFGSLFLSTCHRTEIYYSTPNLAETHSEILQLLRQEIDLPFEHNLYSYFGQECFTHLARVVSGLDSVILGEGEIQRQVKRAYESALTYRKLPAPLHFLFQKSFKIAKELRSSDFFPRGSLSLESVLFHLSSQFGGRDTPALFVGNSAINRKILDYFRKKGMKDLTICTRAPEAAADLLEAGVKLMPWHKLNSWQEFPFVICGTNRSNFIINSNQISEDSPLQTRLVVDLCVPRNVDPGIGRHPQITLFNIEEISGLLQAKEGKYIQEILLCKDRLNMLVERQFSLFLGREESSICYA
ncbi:MAG: glutamyl-tRNA reductase [Chlamydiales bacterium]|nr:glutamyl-tRNA reductase [Chlamydiales bacterium]